MLFAMFHQIRKMLFFAISTLFFIIFASEFIREHKIMKKIFVLCLTLLSVSLLEAKVCLPKLFQSGMVLQRGKTIPVWGKADAGEAVTLRFNKKQYTTTADTEGKWRIDLPKMKAGGPFVLEVRGENEEVIEYTDVLIGDVWLCSGQSNIDVHIERVYPQMHRRSIAMRTPRSDCSVFRTILTHMASETISKILPSTGNL